WDHARPGQGIRDSMLLEIASAPGLIGRWPLDVVSGSTTPCTVSGGPAGTVVGGAACAPGAAFATTPDQAACPPRAPVPAEQWTGVATSPELSVAASDPDGGSLGVTFYGRPTGGGSQAGPDFTLIGLPDTQFYVSSLNGGTPAIFDAQTSWIVANRNTRNIVD